MFNGLFNTTSILKLKLLKIYKIKKIPVTLITFHMFKLKVALSYHIGQYRPGGRAFQVEQRARAKALR